jgi:TonB family protein
MNRFALTSAICLALTCGVQIGVAQDSSATSNVIDAKNPPAGFVAPRPSAERDLSMARYARESYLDGEEGIVGLRVVVRQDGSVADAQIVTSSGSMRLDQAAQEVVKDWRYEPATMNGAPVEASVSVEIVWALETLRFEITPQMARNLPSYYPLDAARRREQGVSIVRFLTAADGSVTKAVIDRPSGHAQLDEAAVNMIKTGWKLSGGSTTTGEPVGGWFRVNVAWVLARGAANQAGICGTPPGTTVDEQIRACTEFLSSSSLTPYERAYAHRARGLAHAAKRDLDNALADYDAAIRASPGIAELYISRASARLQLGNKELALIDLDTAVQVEPVSYNIRMARGTILHAAGLADKAVADIDIGVRIAPAQNQPAAYNDRCFFLARIGRAQDGLADCDRSLMMRPRNAATLDSRGYAYLRLGQYQMAIRDYDSALRINPKIAAALYGRGVAKLKLGDRRGEADMNAAKQLTPGIAEQMADVGVTP